jgi:hypothetical protein
MATEDLITGRHAPREPMQTPCVFAVRLWKEELAGRSEYRGSVRDVRSDAFRAFRDWSDLVAFMVSRMEQDDSARRVRAEGGT